MESLSRILTAINDIMWGPPMLILLFGTHLFLTIRLGFIQKYMLKAIKISFKPSTDGHGDISHFGALTTALAATIGTGNIVGVATAIGLGGPGAVLWMWLTGVFGIATKYAEAFLSVKYRIVNANGQMAGGPMYVLEKALKMKWLGIIFAIMTAIAAFGIGNTVQSNSIAVMIHDYYKIAPWITGLFLTILTAMVILGGIKSLSRFCTFLVPFMAIFYIIGCILLAILHFNQLGDAIILIVKSAFTGQAAAGGFLGAGIKEAMRYGIARGLFSNESGMGSAPIVAAAAKTKDPVSQALVSSSGTFWDTVVVCAFTGIVIVASGAWTSGLSGSALTKLSFEGLGLIGSAILTIGLFTFVYSTILGWSYYGEKAAEYLLGTKIILPYRILWVIAVFFGAIANVPIVWSFADIANALMAIPNLISLLALSGIIALETKRYFQPQELSETTLTPQESVADK
jgi:AGCS family alanine or glycine:cation symporter